MSLVAYHEIGDLRLSETSGSTGRRLEVAIDLYMEWSSPTDPPMTALASLDVHGARRLVEVLQDWIGTQ